MLEQGRPPSGVRPPFTAARLAGVSLVGACGWVATQLTSSDGQVELPLVLAFTCFGAVLATVTELLLHVRHWRPIGFGWVLLLVGLGIALVYAGGALIILYALVLATALGRRRQVLGDRPVSPPPGRARAAARRRRSKSAGPPRPL